MTTKEMHKGHGSAHSNSGLVSVFETETFDIIWFGYSVIGFWILDF